MLEMLKLVKKTWKMFTKCFFYFSKMKNWLYPLLVSVCCTWYTVNWISFLWSICLRWETLVTPATFFRKPLFNSYLCPCLHSFLYFSYLSCAKLSFPAMELSEIRSLNCSRRLWFTKTKTYNYRIWIMLDKINYKT